MRRTFKRNWKNETRDFLDEIQDLDLEEMISVVESKKNLLGEEVRELKFHGMNSHFYERLRFFQDMKGLLYLLQNGSFPDTLHPEYLGKYRWVVEKLVRKNQLDKSVLELFDE